jgi:hypothetical protein
MFEHDVRDWINGYLAEKSPEHNNIPRCPYAQKALVSNTVHFETSHSEEQTLGIVQRVSLEWNDDTHQAVAIHLDWDIDDEERLYICNSCLTFYGLQNDLVFIEEKRVLNDTTYNMILVHRFSEMQHAKRTLRRKGYYQDNA